MNKLKKHPYLFLSSIITFCLGLLFVFLDYSKIIDWLYFVVSSFLIIGGLYKLFDQNKVKENYINGLVNIFIGILLLLFRNFILSIILGCILLVLPIVRIVLSDNKKNTFKQQIPFIILGVLICFSGDIFANVFFKILGVLLMLFAIYQFVSIFIYRLQLIKVNKETSEPKKRRDIIDVTYEEGNGDE